jgi:hypothetical protein
MRTRLFDRAQHSSRTLPPKNRYSFLASMRRDTHGGDARSSHARKPRPYAVATQYRASLAARHRPACIAGRGHVVHAGRPTQAGCSRIVCPTCASNAPSGLGNQPPLATSPSIPDRRKVRCAKLAGHRSRLGVLARNNHSGQRRTPTGIVSPTYKVTYGYVRDFQG